MVLYYSDTHVTSAHATWIPWREVQTLQMMNDTRYTWTRLRIYICVCVCACTHPPTHIGPQVLQFLEGLLLRRLQVCQKADGMSWPLPVHAYANVCCSQTAQWGKEGVGPATGKPFSIEKSPRLPTPLLSLLATTVFLPPSFFSKSHTKCQWYFYPAALHITFMSASLWLLPQAP